MRSGYTSFRLTLQLIEKMLSAEVDGYGSSAYAKLCTAVKSYDITTHIQVT